MTLYDLPCHCPGFPKLESYQRISKNPLLSPGARKISPSIVLFTLSPQHHTTVLPRARLQRCRVAGCAVGRKATWSKGRSSILIPWATRRSFTQVPLMEVSWKYPAAGVEGTGQRDVGGQHPFGSLVGGKWTNCPLLAQHCMQPTAHRM